MLPSGNITWEGLKEPTGLLGTQNLCILYINHTYITILKNISGFKKNKRGKSSVTMSDAEGCFIRQGALGWSASGMEAAPKWERFPFLQAAPRKGCRPIKGPTGEALPLASMSCSCHRKTMDRTKSSTLLTHSLAPSQLKVIAIIPTTTTLSSRGKNGPKWNENQKKTVSSLKT